MKRTKKKKNIVSDQIRCALKKENNTKQTETRLVVKRKLRFLFKFTFF